MVRVSSFGTVKSEWRDRLIRMTQKLMPFEWNEIALRHCPDQRTDQLLAEEEKFLKTANAFTLVDVTGKHMDSKAFYAWCFRGGNQHLLIGPAVGFHKQFFERAESKISLSSLTLTHELAQVVLAESIYRSACMLKNHPFVK